MWWTIAILIADSVLGSLLMRCRAGRVAALQRGAAAGRPPAREVLDGVLVIFGGAFLLTPGFITDIFGALSCSRRRARSCGGCWCGVRGADDRATRARAGVTAPSTGRATSTGTAVDVAADPRRDGHRDERAGRCTGDEGFTDAVTFAFADRDAGFFGLARAGIADGQGSALGVLFAGREPVERGRRGRLALDAAGTGTS